MLNIEPLNNGYDEQSVCAAIGAALTDFYTALTRTLDKIDVDKILKRKIPIYIGQKGSTAQVRSWTVFWQPMYLQVKKPCSATAF